MAYKKTANADIAAIKKKMVELKDSGLLPKGYARMVKEKLGLKNADKVYQVTGGHQYHEEITDALLELASENKVKAQLSKIDDILS